MMNREKKAGFTLVEILIVVGIVAVLAAIAIPNFVKARQHAEISACVRHLRKIDAAKEQWAIEYKKRTGARPDIQALIPYIKDGIGDMICPLAKEVSFADSYVVEAIGEDPLCRIDGERHRL